MKRELICIVCPLGCKLTVEINGDNITVSGNNCPKGGKYAKDECTNPMRTVTSTVRCDSGDVISVKTDKAIAKDKIFECMKIINNSVAHLPVSIGDVIIKDVFGSNIIATQNK